MARFALGLTPSPVEQGQIVVKSMPSCSTLPNLLQRGAAPPDCKQSVAGLVTMCAGVVPASQSGSPWLMPQMPLPLCVLQCSPTRGASDSPVNRPVSPDQLTPRLPFLPKGSRFDVSELQIGSHPFDPTTEAMKSQLASKLAVGTCLSIDVMHTGTGGLNGGMWKMRTSSHQDLILKLVSANRQEGSKVTNLARNHPNIVHDPTLAFPLHVFHCIGADGTKRYDLIVMEKAQGRALADFIGSKWHSQGADCVIRVMRKLGSCLRDFHTRYRNSQHGDFQPSNIFYDEAADRLTLVDVADIGTQQAHHNDKQHFFESLRIISQAYGPKFLNDAAGAFEAGYAR